MAGEGRFGLNIDAVYVHTGDGPVPLLTYLEAAGGGDAPAWGDVTGKPSQFPPASHTHVVGDVDGLTAVLDGKQSAGDYATTATVTSLAGRVTALEDADPVITRTEFDALVARVTELETPEEGP